MTSDGIIHGVEGIPLHIICVVDSGIPKENITLYSGQNKLIVGGPGKLSYVFVPERENNGQTFSCVVQSESLDVTLEKQMILDIKRKYASLIEV